MQQQLEALDLTTTVLPYEIDGTMREWLESHLTRRSETLDQIQVLVDLLLDEKEGLGVQYRREPTLTAREVFDAGQANCLSFTLLFVGLARELDLEVYFLQVEDLEDYGREGDLVVHSDHIAVGVGPGHDLTVIDFAREVGNYRRVRALTDREAIALYYSNRGAEFLRAGDNDQALRWLADATRVYPGLPGPWINLGVALRRSGDLASAESAYRAALELEPNSAAALHNLAGLLQRQGREEEALALQELAASPENRNPYALLALADLSLRHGRVEDAGRLYRRALRLQAGDEEAEFLAALGLFELRQERRTTARKLLRKAEKSDPGHPRVRQLRMLLSN